MPRFRRLNPDEFPDEAGDLIEQIMRVSADGIGGPFNMMLRSPAMGRRLMALLAYFNDETKVLQPTSRRLAVLILARRVSARYAWWTHRRRALAGGEFTEAQLDALNRGIKPDDLSPRHAAVFDYVVDLALHGRTSDISLSALRDHLEEDEIVELISLCGTYTTVAYLLNEGDVGLPEGEEDTLIPLENAFAK